jgi:hypothetical protein
MTQALAEGRPRIKPRRQSDSARQISTESRQKLPRRAANESWPKTDYCVSNRGKAGGLPAQPTPSRFPGPTPPRWPCTSTGASSGVYNPLPF